MKLNIYIKVRRPVLKKVFFCESNPKILNQIWLQPPPPLSLPTRHKSHHQLQSTWDSSAWASFSKSHIVSRSHPELLTQPKPPSVVDTNSCSNPQQHPYMQSTHETVTNLQLQKKTSKKNHEDPADNLNRSSKILRIATRQQAWHLSF